MHSFKFFIGIFFEVFDFLKFLDGFLVSTLPFEEGLMFLSEFFKGIFCMLLLFFLLKIIN